MYAWYFFPILRAFFGSLNMREYFLMQWSCAWFFGTVLASVFFFQNHTPLPSKVNSSPPKTLSPSSGVKYLTPPLSQLGPWWCPAFTRSRGSNRESTDVSVLSTSCSRFRKTRGNTLLAISQKLLRKSQKLLFVTKVAQKLLQKSKQKILLLSSLFGLMRKCNKKRFPSSLLSFSLIPILKEWFSCKVGKPKIEVKSKTPNANIFFSHWMMNEN